MTEAEWLACSNLYKMLTELCARIRGRPSSWWERLTLLDIPHQRWAETRRLRLFVCACCRQIWPLLREEQSRRAVETSEAYADSLTDRKNLRRAASEAEQVAILLTGISPSDWGVDTSAEDDLSRSDEYDEFWEEVASNSDAVGLAAWAAVWAVKPGCHSFEAVWAARGKAARRSTWSLLSGGSGVCECQFLRDIFGNPFRPSPSLPPAVIAWHDWTVRRIAEGIYGDRAFDRLPVLADALLDAGCDNEDLLAHCRSKGPHVKGCWALDLILGRQ